MQILKNTLKCKSFSEDLISCLLETEKILKDKGVRVRAYSEADIWHFNSLNEQQKSDIVYYANVYRNVLASVQKKKVNFKNNADVLWETIADLGLRPHSDFFNILSDDDKLEIYNIEGAQVWRNFNVMRVCSYSLAQMYSYSWDQRYQRADEDTQKVMDAVNKVLSSKESKVYAEFIPTHEVVEKFSEHQYVLAARHDYFCPLFDTNRIISGFVVTSKVKIVDTKNKNIKAHLCDPKNIQELQL